MRIKTKLEITELICAEGMNKNLLWFELINLVQGFESKLLEYKGLRRRLLREGGGWEGLVVVMSD